jgi:predicted nucleotide-binding protein
VGASTAIDGLGDAVVAYGYVMGGSTLSACALTNSVVTTTLYSSTTKVFTGAKYQHVNSIMSPKANAAASTTIAGILTTASNVGNNALYTKAASASSFITITSDGIATVSAQNFYYDFAQTNVF